MGGKNKPGIGLIKRILSIAVVCLILIVIVAPFYVAVVYAVKSPEEMGAVRLSWPQKPTLENFVRVIAENKQFIIGYRNSILTTVPTVLILMVVTSMAAYVLARNTGRFYNMMYTIFTMGILIPYHCIMLPMYLNFYNLGLTNSLTGYSLAKIGLQISFSVLVVTSFVKNIPKELEEAAYIDGANRFSTFWRVVFPLMKPINVTQLVLNSLFCWNDYSVALVMLRANEVKTLPLAQVIYFTDSGTELNLAFAFFIMAMIPILILYLSMQKYIVQGITAGAVKG